MEESDSIDLKSGIEFWGIIFASILPQFSLIAMSMRLMNSIGKYPHWACVGYELINRARLDGSVPKLVSGSLVSCLKWTWVGRLEPRLEAASFKCESTLRLLRDALQQCPGREFSDQVSLEANNDHIPPLVVDSFFFVPFVQLKGILVTWL